MQQHVVTGRDADRCHRRERPHVQSRPIVHHRPELTKTSIPDAEAGRPVGSVMGNQPAFVASVAVDDAQVELGVEGERIEIGRDRRVEDEPSMPVCVHAVGLRFAGSRVDEYACDVCVSGPTNPRPVPRAGVEVDELRRIGVECSDQDDSVGGGKRHDDRGQRLVDVDVEHGRPFAQWCLSVQKVEPTIGCRCRRGAHVKATVGEPCVDVARVGR